MFLSGLLGFTSHSMGHAEIKMMDSWKLGTNLFTILVAESGSGKSGAVKLFSQEISKIQKEDISSYDQQHQQTGKDPSPTKKQKTEPTNVLFHKKKRIIGQVTPQALILSLAEGNNSPIIVCDEMKDLGDKVFKDSSLKAVLCKSYDRESFVDDTVTRGSTIVDESAVTLSACIQPGALTDLFKMDPDYMGFYSRLETIGYEKGN